MKSPSRLQLVRFVGMVAVLVASSAYANEHFQKGEIRASLSWDNVSAMESGIYRFGASAGIEIANGVELGYEQQFIVPPGPRYEARSWGYVRVTPFRQWFINPFVAARTGYYITPDRNAVAAGAGIGAVMFLDEHMAFEVSLFEQGAFYPTGKIDRQTDFDTRFVLYF